MCHPFLRDSRFYSLLQKIDEDLAERTRLGRCPLCGGPLHRSDYPRKPRGELVELSREFRRRFSFCCARDDCRRRATPPSVRFLSRRVYLGVVVVLVTALRQGPSPPGEAKLKRELGIDRRTLERWQEWWQKVFPRGEFWRQARRQLHPRRPPARLLPRALVDLFGAEDAVENLLRCLRFLAPESTALRISEHASLWPC